MKLVDANVLLYADNEDAAHHHLALSWLERALEGNETLVVPWVSAVAYLRISTHPRVQASPRSAESAAAFLRAVLDCPPVIAGEPDRHHLDRVETLLAATGVGGNLVSDAHLGALALQYDATVVSFDNDFSRFPGVRWERPTAPATSKESRDD